MEGHSKVRIAAVGDLHCTRGTEGRYQPFLSMVAERADMLVLCGDLTDYGTEEEAHILARELHAVKVPIVGVLGNHDYESDHQEQVKAILGEAGVTILDGTAHVVGPVGFAGVKGFCGGFGRRGLTPFGEPGIKRFVHDGMDEMMKLEAAMARLRTPLKVAITHYSPIAATVQGEPLEIFPFLGSSRLEEPIDRYRANLAFHGHAHRGSLLGHTRGNVPVYNVALPLLRRLHPDAPPFHVVELAVEEEMPVDMPNMSAMS